MQLLNGRGLFSLISRPSNTPPTWSDPRVLHRSADQILIDSIISAGALRADKDADFPFYGKYHTNPDNSPIQRRPDRILEPKYHLDAISGDRGSHVAGQLHVFAHYPPYHFGGNCNRIFPIWFWKFHTIRDSFLHSSRCFSIWFGYYCAARGSVFDSKAKRHLSICHLRIFSLKHVRFLMETMRLHH